MRRSNIEYVQFSVLPSESIKKLSVCEVTLPASGSTEERQNTPYDQRMGVLEDGAVCGTCYYDSAFCPGHMGHIPLPFPILNILFLQIATKVLQSVCSKCGRMRVLPQFSTQTPQGFNALKHFSEKGKKVFKCPWTDCGSPLYGFLESKDGEFERYYKDPKSTVTPFSAGQALSVFKKITAETASLLGIANITSTNPEFFTQEGEHIHVHHPKDFIITDLPVIPPPARPYIVKDGQICDDDLTEKYNTIVKLVKKYVEYSSKPKTTKSGKTIIQKVENKEKIATELRNNVWSLMIKDSESKQSTTGHHHKSIEERIGKKEGQIQTNIAGKRSDYTARDVITGGGILLREGEFGVPRCIASEITYPEMVNDWNKRVLQNLVKRGLINKVIRREPNGKCTTLRLAEFPDKGCDYVLKVGDIVRRQLIDEDGWYDMFIANRQPSLRTESMKGYRLKVIEGNAYRLPEMNTKSFGADYDGDEMNLHFLQSIGANAECRILLRAAIHLVTAQRNGPVDGVVQDGLVGALLMTNSWNDGQDTFVKISSFKDIMLNAEFDMKNLPSFYRRAKQYYSDYVSEHGFKEGINIIPGKLAFSMILPETLRYKSKTNTNVSYPWVKIAFGIIKPDSGPMCSKVIGSKQLSITHKLWKEYCPDVAMKFLSDVQQLTNRWLPDHGFSIGVKDCTNTKSELIAQTFAETQIKVNAILDRCNGTPTPDDEMEIIATLSMVSGVATKIGSEGMTGGEKNALNIMRNAGAKGSIVNLAQITASVGQQIINGKRVPLGVCGGTRTLSHFPKGDHGSDARGMVFSSYLEGYTPQESIFHAMSGREGIISTGVKTADTGYIQKRIVKKIEDFSAWIDGTIRDANGRIIQFMYGDDGMDAKKIYNVKGVAYPFCVNPQSIADQLNAHYILSGGEKVNKRYLNSTEIELLLNNFIHAGHPYQKSKIIQNQTRILRKNIGNLLKETKIYEACIPDLCVGIRNVVECSKVQAGEMVGIVAGTSLGEPTTQMVLNVFHFTGIGGKDASLGVPRFNEVLNATKSDKQKKPNGTLYFVDEYKNMEEVDFTKFVRKTFEESYVCNFLKEGELQYVGEWRDDRCSPASTLTYTQHQEEWWQKLYTTLHHQEQNLDDWVLMLNFDVEKLCDKSITLLEIATAINENSEKRYIAIPSPTCMGKVEIRCDFSSMEDAIEELIEAQPGLITKANVKFFIMRDICLEFVKKIFISGVKGISRVFVRKEEDEWVVDAAFARATQISAHKRFLDILTHPSIDYTRTVCDDMHTLNSTFGIEAARKFIIQEKDRIISFDGTYVNKRHLQILVDSMTHTGDITSVRRDGIPRSVGPIAKMMFEDSVPNTIQSSVFSEMDDKVSISSSVMLGTLSKIGTCASTILSEEAYMRTRRAPLSPKQIQIPIREETITI